MDPNEIIPKITATLDALLRNDSPGAYNLLAVILGDAQFWRDFEDWGGQNRRGQTSMPKRSSYPRPEPKTEN